MCIFNILNKLTKMGKNRGKIFTHTFLIALLAVGGIYSLYKFWYPNYKETMCNIWDIKGPKESKSALCNLFYGDQQISFYYSYPNSSRACINTVSICGYNGELLQIVDELKDKSNIVDGYNQVKCYYLESKDPCYTNVIIPADWFYFWIFTVLDIMIIILWNKTVKLVKEDRKVIEYVGMSKV